MKLIQKRLLAAVIAAACVLPLAAEKKYKAPSMKPVKSNWVLYLPGKANKKDVQKDMAKSGWVLGSEWAKHFEFADSNMNGGKVLRFSTLDGAQDAMILPLSGKEKKVTVIFKAKGANDPDNTAKKTPFGAFYSYVQKGSWQTLLRHNSSNQIKGEKNMSRLNPDDVVSDWHDFRLVFDIPDDGPGMTATAVIDGNMRHQDQAKERTDFTAPLNFDKSEALLGYLTGTGNYLEFGDNDGSTNAFERYAYILVVIDEDVSTMSLEDMGKKVGADLVTNPVTSNDPGPVSKRPAKKPAGINIMGPEVNSADPTFYDTSTINNGKLNLDKLPFSHAKVSVINRTPAEEKFAFAATVDPNGSGANVYKTIGEAIAAVKEGSAIKVMPGMYYEKLVITKPGISLIGTDPASTIIYGYEADTGGIDGNILVEVNYLPKDAVTEPGKAAPIPDAPAANAYFNAENITFYNKGYEWNKLWGGAEPRSVALGMKGVDQSYIKNCIFMGQLDTMYFRSGRVYMENCFIEGTGDYICGGATVLFDNCQIYTRSDANGGIIVAAAGADTGYKSTAKFANGYVFRSCKIEGPASFAGATKKVVIGRGSWVGGSAVGDTVQAKTVYMNCALDNIFEAKPWNDWDSVNTAAKSFFREYKNTGAGAAVNADRPQMTDAEYKATYSSTEKILGFTPIIK